MFLPSPGDPNRSINAFGFVANSKSLNEDAVSVDVSFSPCEGDFSSSDAIVRPNAMQNGVNGISSTITEYIDRYQAEEIDTMYVNIRARQTSQTKELVDFAIKKGWMSQ